MSGKGLWVPLPRGGGQRGRTDDTYGTEILPALENMPSGPPLAHAFSALGGAGMGLEDGTGLAESWGSRCPAKRRSTQLSTFRVNVQTVNRPGSVARPGGPQACSWCQGCQAPFWRELQPTAHEGPLPVKTDPG